MAARNPNVYLETSGMPMHTKIREAVDRIGADRVMYCSDAPFHHPRVEMEKVAVLPVPDWACAMTSLPVVCQFCFFRCVGGVVGVVCVWANSPLMTGMMARC